MGPASTGGRVWHTVAVVLAAVTLSATVQQRDSQQPLAPVRIFVTALDAAGRPLTDLAPGDFDVRADGKAVPIQRAARSVTPLNLLVLLDVSGSVIGSHPQLPTGLVAVTTRLHTGDRVRVGAFASIVALAPALGDIQKAVDRVRAAGPATRLWDAIDDGMSLVGAIGHRPVVVIVSDGQDSASRRTDDVQLGRRAVREHVTIYGVTLRSTLPATRGSAVFSTHPEFRNLAERSGGRVIETRSESDIAPAFSQMMDDLSAHYEVDFQPPLATDRERTLEVRIRRPNVRVLAPRRYVAPRAQGDGRTRF